MIRAAVLLALALPANAQEHRFFDKPNTVLFTTEVVVRGLDAYTTRRAVGSTGHDEYLPDSIVRSGPKMYGYSLGAAGLYIGLAYVLHRSRHHRLERLTTVFDIAYDGPMVVHNARIIW